MANPDRCRRWRLKNKAHTVAYQRARASIRADRLLQRKYGITTKERNRILRGQGYRCAGCRKPKRGHWHTDHCHKSGEVRGVLCGPCNRALGLVYDKPATLRRLASYLEK